MPSAAGGAGFSRPGAWLAFGAIKNYTAVLMARLLGELEQILLYALMHLGPGTSGIDVRDLIEDRTGKGPAPGAIYTAFDRLEQRGLVRSTLGEPTAERGGKRRRLYTMTAAGRTALAQSRATLSAMASGLDARFERR